MGNKSKGKKKIVKSIGFGYHNEDLMRASRRLEREGSYKDLSTIIIFPSLATLHTRCVARWFDLMMPMNQKVFRLWPQKEWIDDAYNKCIEFVLAHPELSKWKYILTLEADNVPPPDGLIRLLEDVNEADAIGGLYWTKGMGGQPMIYGNPTEVPLSFRPQLPIPDTLQRCNGLGMGFTLFKVAMFKDVRIPKPWFKTEQSYQHGVGARAYTQDLYFFEKIAGLGYKVACDTRVRVGHYDPGADHIW